ncbi:similar to Saccharomyces cerevisiae YFR027W ECO1 Acetyltransferase required for establishment of sister chromatid cohesion [Maudiozyma saulgeensis]|uniref:N-acetyltransferase ECO1 n=1 Tax=Maudiozyma saulgeensis TaxID=1789683 RepID=A0A1X7R0M5_9SACH|nr:similar to Saccharomyces cerevisiae YFR027W ECO1 Acetyltransferase required for establishment of sister chromatid cohesion [Kazachstania saulgeensis]
MKPRNSQRTKSVRSTKKYSQSRLQLDGFQGNKLIKCAKCEMAYSPNNIEDTTAHRLFHDTYLKGRKWSRNWGTVVSIPTNSMTPPSSQHSSSERIVMIRPNHPQEVNATLDVMNIVNNELHAPHDENSFWVNENGKGKAFLYIKNDRAVSAITIEQLDEGRGKWMLYDSKKLVPNVTPKFELGISRIWVCKSQRGNKIATKLLEAARHNMVIGKSYQKWSLAWSQPTDDGGKLASKYNAVTHKSGKLLIPCYI